MVAIQRRPKRNTIRSVNSEAIMVGTVEYSRTTVRLGSGLLILAAVVMTIGAAIPFVAPSLREAPWTDDAQQAVAVIAGNPSAYATAHGLFVAAAILTSLGLVPVSLGFQGRSRPWAMMAVVAFAFAAAFSAVDRTINMQVYTWGAVAVQGLQVTDILTQALIHFQAGLDLLFNILAYLALGLFGIAMLQRPDPSGFGWVFVVGGIFAVVLYLVGGTIPAYVYFGTAALGATTWLLGSDLEREKA